MMKRILLAAVMMAALWCAGAADVAAQSELTTAKQYMDRYNMLVGKFGYDGVGIETLLGKWEKAFPDDTDMMQAAFLFYFSKSQTKQVVVKDAKRFLGEGPVLTLKDSLDRDVNYFQESMFDDELFGKAVKYIDKAIQMLPLRLDLRFGKITALIGYEKESPEMASRDILSLVDFNASRHPKWEFPDVEVTDEYFDASIQDYCYLFYKYGTPKSFATFRDISAKMVSYKPSSVLFLDNLGSYYFVVEHNNKTAMKYYTKVLKIDPKDLAAIKNSVLLCRADKNVKGEKKYLQMLINATEDEIERKSAQTRLESL